MKKKDVLESIGDHDIDNSKRIKQGLEKHYKLTKLENDALVEAIQRR